MYSNLKFWKMLIGKELHNRKEINRLMIQHSSHHSGRKRERTNTKTNRKKDTDSPFIYYSFLVPPSSEYKTFSTQKSFFFQRSLE